MAAPSQDFAMEIVQIQSVLPQVTDAEARSALALADGNVETALEQFLIEGVASAPPLEQDLWELSSAASSENAPTERGRQSDTFNEQREQEVDDSHHVPCLHQSEPEPTNSSAAEKPWEVLRDQDLRRAMLKDIDDVVDFTGLSSQEARVFLSHCGWDRTVLLEKYADDSERSLRQAGVLGSGAPERGQQIAAPGKCASCLEEHPEEALVAKAPCGHRFCQNCWDSYLLMKVREGESCRLRCMSFRCGTICDDELVARALQVADPTTAERFHRTQLEAYVGENRTGHIVWCPSKPHCGRALRLCGRATGEFTCEVVCECNKRFCFGCQEEAHTPASCEMWRSWRDKETGESVTSDWLRANSKPCPKCKKPVEKNGGCNHVTCRCGQSFCWHCGVATGAEHSWQSIANHSCGRFAVEAAEKAKVAEAELQRYLFYYGRWKTHMDSLKYEVQQEERVKEKISGLEQQRQEYLADYQWLVAGASQLSVCRRILAHSYIFAFFALGKHSMFADELTPERELVYTNVFEVKQQDLEQVVETLSKLVETPLEQMDKDMAKIKQMVVDLTINVDQRSLNLCETVQNDILGQLSSPQGIAPYFPQTQVVRRMVRRPLKSAMQEPPLKRRRTQGRPT